MHKKTKTLITPDGTTCSWCGGLCKVIFNDNSFDYAGTHCTYGIGGTHYPDDYGDPVSDCCESPCVNQQGEEITIDECDPEDF